MAKEIRKHYIVKKRLQVKLFFETALLMCFIAVIVGWTVYLAIFRVLIFELSGEKLTLINRFISFRMVIWFLPALFSIVIMSVFFSHKLAGPIFVFQRTINALTDGAPVEKVHLRKSDKLKDFASDLNKLIDSLSSR